MTVASRIRVTGIVQGVGFRPFVWRLARELEIAGWVRNDPDGVEISAEGEAARVGSLIERLRLEAPPLARIDTVSAADARSEGASGFAIVDSARSHAHRTAIGPDVGVCDDCLDELFDPAGRRWRHAFITCTHCGPRYTVTRGLPYDRPQTSLAPFPLCGPCAIEYREPANRRFHAETTCCPACGPRLSLCDVKGVALDGDPIAVTLKRLQDGAIVAIKGLGGFHLACDARNGAAVARLRARKDREAKPFAVMLANLASLATHATVTDAEAALLQGRERPVVLLPRHEGNDAVLAGVAPGLDTLGVMLPTTPIHYLLFHEAAARPEGTAWLQAAQGMVLVMTSANPGGEPIVRTDDEAAERLGGIADLILGHDRDIVARCDDSVMRVVAGAPHFIRRSRGYSPGAIRLPRGGPSVLAFGAHLKNTVCVTRDAEAFVSAHVGDLDTAETCGFLDETVARLLDLLDVRPDIVAHDMHPDTYSTRAANEFAARLGLPLVAVQHHHAHIAAVCAEQGVCEPVLGVALDGVGFGSDGAAWGGELLRVDGARFERLGHLRPLPLPGGDRAAREPWRMGAAVLHEAGRVSEIVERFREPAAVTVALMLGRDLNCPRTSSMGRVFDAAAGLLGLCSRQQFEAQAAMKLEQTARRHVAAHGWPGTTESNWVIGSVGGASQLDLLPALVTLTEADSGDAAAARFHAVLVAALGEWIALAAAEQGIKTVAWSGGCFFNDLLSTGLLDNLTRRGLNVRRPRQSSPGDAGISLGQAWVALQGN
ncbi:MAG: carbamoyltransferase HypF [Sulfuritalea sp.]|nr:carbamoyltransferase HypF [Sulfuritalea sp.]